MMTAAGARCVLAGVFECPLILVRPPACVNKCVVLKMDGQINCRWEASAQAERHPAAALGACGGAAG